MPPAPTILHAPGTLPTANIYSSPCPPMPRRNPAEPPGLPLPLASCWSCSVRGEERGENRKSQKLGSFLLWPLLSFCDFRSRWALLLPLSHPPWDSDSVLLCSSLCLDVPVCSVALTVLCTIPAFTSVLPVGARTSTPTAGIWRPLIGTQPCAKDVKLVGKFEVRVIIIWASNHIYMLLLLFPATSALRSTQGRCSYAGGEDEEPEAQGGKETCAGTQLGRCGAETRAPGKGTA